MIHNTITTPVSYLSDQWVDVITKDRIFLLSVDEVKSLDSKYKWFTNNQRLGVCTEYAFAMGTRKTLTGLSAWWLRTDGAKKIVPELSGTLENIVRMIMRWTDA